MRIVTDPEPDSATLARFFEAVFTDSESAEEGRVIGGLVRALLDEVAPEERRLFTMLDGAVPVACILFTRLAFPEDTRRVFLLSPVAVATLQQGKGLGQRLIRHGLEALRADGVDVVVTYGDPAFYGRVGFAPVTQGTLAPPQDLSQPEGWIAQALDGGPIRPLKGASRAVAPFNDPALW